ncbi:MAG: DUF2905 domain-containing protein [Chloroflexi bacterium]|nr:DUF2905 domain-containing protein [Chloroflexota bacterium]
MEAFGRLLIQLGLLFLFLGVILWLIGRLGVPFGRLPGDIVIQKGNVTCMFPIMTSLLLSLLLTLILNLLARGWPMGE